MFFFDLDTPTHEHTEEFEISTQKQTLQKKNTGRILIISAGSAIFLALILIILHELVTYRQMSIQIDVHQVVDDMYEDIDAV